MFSLKELFDVVLMTIVVGYLFMDLFRRDSVSTKDAFLFSCTVTAPAIILHELGHKIVGILFGLVATFHAAYVWLGLGLILKFMNFGFIFFVPAYVELSGTLTPLSSMMTAFAGPLVNGVLFGVSWVILRVSKKLKHRTFMFLQVTKQINLFLFVFNMLPIPGFDGLKVYEGLFNFLI